MSQLIAGITILLSEHRVRNLMVHRCVGAMHWPVSFILKLYLESWLTLTLWTASHGSNWSRAAKKRVIISRNVQAIPMLWRVYIFHFTVYIIDLLPIHMHFGIHLGSDMTVALFLYLSFLFIFLCNWQIFLLTNVLQEVYLCIGIYSYYVWYSRANYY